MPVVSMACLSIATCIFLVLLDLATTPVGCVRLGGDMQADAGSRPQAEATRLSPTACGKRPASLDGADTSADRRRA